MLFKMERKIMRKLTRFALALGILIGAADTAYAQPAPDEHATHNPAIKSPNRVIHGRLDKGHNSFTSGEAQHRLEKAGYQHVSGLALDNDGLWQAQAVRHGHAVHIALDYKGNVSAR